MSLDAFFTPRHIAYVGASDDPAKPAGRALGYALGAYRGQISVVNRRRRTVQGHPAVPSADDLPDGVDLAVVTVAAEHAVSAVASCARRNVRAAVVIAGGFAEAGPAGAGRQRELTEIARATGIRILGPNTVGLCNPRIRLYATFSSSVRSGVRPGRVGLISASGFAVTSALRAAAGHRLGFAAIAHCGNAADVTLTELIRHFADDEGIDAIIGYVEGFRAGEDVRGAIEYAAETCGKDLILYKAGASETAARAAASHTGALVGGHANFQALARRSGVVLTESIEELIDVAAFLRPGRPVRGRRVMVLTGSGGAGVIQADRAARAGLELPRPSEALADALAGLLPAYSAVGNPVDGTSALPRHPEQVGAALRAIGASGEYDAVTVKIGTTDDEVRTLLGPVSAAATAMTAPLACVWSLPDDVAEQAAAAGLVSYPSGRAAIDAIAQLAGRAPVPAAATVHPVRRVRPAAVRAAAGRPPWTPTEQALRAAGIPLITTADISDPAAAGDVETVVGPPPWVAKLSGPGLAHRSDIGAVRTAVGSAGQLRTQAAELLDLARRRHIAGAVVSVQPYLRPACEVLVSLTRDPLLGWFVVAGFGGTLTEIVREAVAIPCPPRPGEAEQALRHLFGGRWTSHHRGLNKAQQDAVAEVLYRLGGLPAAVEPTAETELNPLMVEADGTVTAVDWLFTPLTQNPLPQEQRC